jgi:sodium-dependent dicarboxylate transporter 2/3/5
MSRSTIQWIGMAAGPLGAAVAYLLLPDRYVDPAGAAVPFTSAGRATLAVMAWMGTWWLTEAIDISATALLPVALFPLLGIASMQAAAAPYADSLIFLFMGGFLLALSMQRCGLDRRIALLTLRVVGPRPVNMIGGFMLATALISAFVSNTATTAMMLPVALGVLALITRPADAAQRREVDRFGLVLMLSIAYAATIGGLATIIGTPPNGFLVSYLRSSIAPEYRRDVSFAEWMLIGVPLAAVFLPLTWILLTRVLYPVRLPAIQGGRAFIREALRDLGPPRAGEWVTLVVFAMAVLAWMFGPILRGLELPWGDDTLRPLSGLSDATIAMTAGVALFLIPVDLRRREFALDWETASKLPLGILILFGGGLSLAGAVQANGVAEFLGSLTAGFATLPALLIVVAVTAAVIFLTELTSNTATAATLIPILAAVAPGLGVHPHLLVVPAAIAASCAFMMPVATPPNAIVFASGHVTIPQMCKAGLWLNLFGVALITGLTYAVVVPLLRIGAPGGG